MRKTIRLLQEIPIILSIVVVIGFLCDIYEIDAAWYLCPLAGFSIYILLRLYMVSRKMYVSRWSRLLYLNLIMVSVVDFTDNIFHFSTKFVNLQEFVFSIFICGVISSLLTFIYDKYKHGF